MMANSTVSLGERDDGDVTVGSLKEPPQTKHYDFEIMEVCEPDVASSVEEIWNSNGRRIQELSRKELEELVLQKIAEGLVATTEMGKLQMKVAGLELQKDQLARKIVILTRQLTNLTAPVGSIRRSGTGNSQLQLPHTDLSADHQPGSGGRLKVRKPIASSTRDDEGDANDVSSADPLWTPAPKVQRQRPSAFSTDNAAITAARKHIPNILRSVKPKTTPSGFTRPKAPASSTSKITENKVPLKPPPKLDVKHTLGERDGEVMLSWERASASSSSFTNLAVTTRYQLCLRRDIRKKAGKWIVFSELEALPLPMTCTLAEFPVPASYHFIVRGIDGFGRAGPWSAPASIVVGNRARVAQASESC